MGKKISFREKIGYGIGAVGLDLSYGLFYSYLSKYLTDVVGISVVFLLILAPLARIWDGINDPMMGTIVDRTRTKMGKYRPWILIGAVLNAIVLCFLFNNPGIDTKSVSMYIYVTIFYVLWGMTNTLADIPFWSRVPSFSSEEKERNSVSTIARIFSGLGQGIIGVLTVPLIKKLGDGTEANAQGYGRWTIICAILLVVFAVISVASSKERVNLPPTSGKFSLKESLRVIKSNDQLLVFMLFAMISNAGYYMTSGISLYYFDNVCGNDMLQSKFFIFGAAGSVLGLGVIPLCSNVFKMNNRKTYIASLSMAAFGYITMFIADTLTHHNIVAIGICYLIASTGIASMFVNQTVMLADVVDYGEYHTGQRNESLTFSMKGFLQKMAYTIQSIIMFGTFAITKYNVLNKTSNPASNTAISFMMFAIPPVFIIISCLIFIKKYKIHGDFKTEVLNKVTQMHGE